MKNLFLVLSFLFSTMLFAASPVYTLNSSDVNIGKLDQGVESSAVGSFIIKRTATSPLKVKLHFAFSEYYSYCSKHATFKIWVPGSSQQVCQTTHVNDQTYTHCHFQYVPGHYAYQTQCVEYDYASTAEQEEVKLDFGKAAVLSADQSETFKVTVMQKSLTSNDFVVTIEPVKVSSSYEISHKKFLIFNKSMSFKFKAI